MADETVKTVEDRISALEARLAASEQALASLAAPMLSQSNHDGHGRLIAWFKRFEEHFHLGIAAGVPPGSELKPSSESSKEASANP